MTGHIPGATVLRGNINAEASRPGTNHVALRAVNERLVLSLIRTHGSLSKAQLAELSGLTVQTASVISRSLIDAGLLVAGAPVRGKVGQPYVPLGLNPTGASFLGVQINPSKIHTAHVNFVGEAVSETMLDAEQLDIDPIMRHVRERIYQIREQAEPGQRARFQAIGVSIANGLFINGRSSFDLKSIERAFKDLSHSLELPVTLAGSALAAASAELIYGLGPTVPDFVYVFLDDGISGGLVRDRRIRFSEDADGPNIADVLVPNKQGSSVPLKTLAVADTYDARSLQFLAEGIAHAAANCAALMPCNTVVVDGSWPAEKLGILMTKLRNTIAQLGLAPKKNIVAREGSMARKPAAMGASALPLLDRYYPEE